MGGSPYRGDSREERTQQISIRVPVDLYEYAKETAEEQTRSVSEQMVHWMKQSMHRERELSAQIENLREELQKLTDCLKCPEELRRRLRAAAEESRSEEQHTEIDE
ncbi:MAG: hypothetical protein GVY14_03120 [Spirochaetes bacterium]|jgi:hypothetical protein|nr:hypothetical protein [Spirochaetota bacterium]